MADNHDHDDDDEVLARTCETLEPAALREQRIACRRRRLVLALHDLGLLNIVGRGWLSVEDDGLAFGLLTDAQADALATRLEDIAEGRPDPVPTPGDGQLGFDFEPVPGPTPVPPETARYHLWSAR